jgi:hypothetical protein
MYDGIVSQLLDSEIAAQELSASTRAYGRQIPTEMPPIHQKDQATGQRPLTMQCWARDEARKVL